MFHTFMIDNWNLAYVFLCIIILKCSRIFLQVHKDDIQLRMKYFSISTEVFFTFNWNIFLDFSHESMNSRIKIWNFQLGKVDVGRIEGKSDCKTELCVHQERHLKMQCVNEAINSLIWGLKCIDIWLKMHWCKAKNAFI